MAKPTFAVLPFAILEDKWIGASEKLVLMALLKWGLRKRECFAKDETIADAAGVSRRTAQTALVKLAELGFIEKVPDKGNPTGRRLRLVWMDDPKYAALFRSDVAKGQGAKWEPGGASKPNNLEVAGWVKRRWKQLPGDFDDKENEIYEELSGHDHDGRIWEWVDQTIAGLKPPKPKP